MVMLRAVLKRAATNLGTPQLAMNLYHADDQNNPERACATLDAYKAPKWSPEARTIFWGRAASGPANL